jgi:arylsulfatase A-like enzyme
LRKRVFLKSPVRENRTPGSVRGRSGNWPSYRDAETLKLNGYSTAQFGKCHETPVWENSPMGPFRQWPTGSGFEHFYGFIAGETNQRAPALIRDTVSIEQERTAEEGYHFTEDMTDHAIQWVRQQKSLMPDKPFFIYYAPGATHAPHHVAPEWADKYKGKFDQGWDKLREETFARQKELGVIPQDAELTPRPAELPAWDDMPDELKPVLVRQMEVYAGFLEHTDVQLGLLIDALEDLDVLDDTLIYYIIGDNGASAEGDLNGTLNEGIILNGASALETPESMAARIDDFGSPRAMNHYAVGWAHAMNTPYQWTKQVASHWGGTRNGTIVRWPNGFKARGELRGQFTHVIDVAATVLEAAGLPEPTIVNSAQQMPLHGVSMLAAFDDPQAPELRETQYFEMFVNRGIYHKGWTAVTRHSVPWRMMDELPAYDDDVWELYAPDDWTQAHDLAQEMPEKLHELKRLFLIEAARYNVLPLDDRRIERFNSNLAGRPQLVRGKSQLLFGGMGRLPENAVLNVKNKSHAVTAQIVVPESGANGVMAAHGGTFGGWSLYAKAGKPVYCYNLLGVKRFKIEGQQTIPSGEHQVRMEFDYDGGGIGKGGTVSLYLDGEPVGQGRVEGTHGLLIIEEMNVGKNPVPVSDDYGPKDSEFTGRVRWVQIDVDEAAEDLDHMITPEERLRVAMARQ